MRLVCLITVLFGLILFLTLHGDKPFVVGFQKYGFLWGLFFGIVCFFLAAFFSNGRQAFDQIDANYLRIFRDDSIESILTNIYQRFEYPAVSSAYHWKNCYYLILTNHAIMIVPDHSFTQGDPAAFGAFIAEKTGLEVKEIK